MKKKWEDLVFVVFCGLALFIPIFGWIIGGINLDKNMNKDDRVGQAVTLIMISTVSFLAALALVSA